MTTDNNAPGINSTGAAPQGPIFQLQRVYLKDASLELPNAPQIFLEQGTPNFEVQLDVSHEDVVDGVREIIVRVTATARVNDKVLFLVEAKQAGIFELRGIPDEQMPAVLGIVCPGIIYPYLRANVADLLTRTGLPPIHLAEINFEALHQQKSSQTAAAMVVPPASQTRQ